MESLRIEILNPKVKSILQNLADLKLIRIRNEDTQSEFKKLLQKLRSKTDAPALEEITQEVEAVRKARYESKEGNS